MKSNHRTLLTLATECRLDTRRAKLVKQQRKDRRAQKLLATLVALNFKQQQRRGNA